MRDSKGKTKPKDNKKMITCKNCRQDIEKEKMFLHEGFCQRNNVFCDHCQKVFLKKDYEKHFKISDKKNLKYLKTPERSKHREKEAKIKTINIYTSPIITKRKTTFEYIEMPMVEQYKVNNPIIISENGQILSNENKNEYLLPYFGINNSKSNERNTILADDIIINQDEFYEETSPVMFKDNNINVNQYIEASLRNSLSMKNINNNYNNINEFENVIIKNNEENSKLNIIDLTNNNNFITSKNSLNRSNSSNILFKNNNLNDVGINQNNNNNLNHEFVHNLSDSKKTTFENKPKNSNIIINNNIITYNSNNNINKIHNFYNTEENNPTTNGKSLMNNNIFKDIISTKFNPTRVSKKNEIIKFKKNLEINIINNASKKNAKEPNDSGNKKKPRNNKLTSYMVERSPQNAKVKKFNLKSPAQTEKKMKKSKKCEFCGSEIEDDLVTHYRIYHYKMSKEILKPQKRDTVLLNEKLNSTTNDEAGIEESNKRILLRELKPSFNLISNLISPRNYNTTAKKKSVFSQIKSKEIIKKLPKKKINLQNIENNIKSAKKLFPEDNIIGSLIAKTQARDYDRRKIIYIGDNFIETKNKNDKIRSTLNPYEMNANNNSNDKIHRVYLFTEGKKDDYQKKMIRSPVVKKINFLKTIFGENEKY